MTLDEPVTLARPWVVFANAAWLSLLLVIPLLLASEAGLAGGPGTALIGVAFALFMALGSRYAVVTARAVGTPTPTSAAPAPTPSWRIPDPVHHPVRPRAPGLV